MFSKEEFDNERFIKKDFSNIEIKDKVFFRCIFENCNFSKTKINSKFTECKFLGSNFSLTQFLNARLQDASFENCKIVGVNFGRCDPMFFSLKFLSCLIDTANFSDSDLKNFIFLNSTVRDTFFKNSNLSKASFANSDLRGSIFHNSNLSKADFKGAVNYCIDPNTNQLAKAEFSKGEVLGLLNYLDIIID